jgi:hypothetical protein
VSVSNAVTITVAAPATPIPVVSIAATTRKAGVINEAIALAATATVSGDTLASVQFRSDGVNIGAPDTASPYSLNHTFTSKGVKQVSAIALASQGGSATSANYPITIFDTKIASGGDGAGTSLVAGAGDFVLFDDNQAAGGLPATADLFISGTQVGVLNYITDAYNGKPFVFFRNSNSLLYSGTIAAGTVNLTPL